MIRKLITGTTLLALTLGGGLLSGCTTSVERMAVEESSDLSGDWNDTDSRLVSEEMIRDVLSRAWITDFQSQKQKVPTVIVGDIKNLSHEHINVATFVGDMERELINASKIEFVASRSERNEIRDERRDQDLNARTGTINAMGQEIGADFMLKGTINSILDTDGKTQVRYYQIDLTLISMADNRKVWVGQKKIKKLVKRPGLRW